MVNNVNGKTAESEAINLRVILGAEKKTQRNTIQSVYNRVYTCPETTFSLVTVRAIAID